MNVQANCKICGQAISATCDDAYSELGDPFKLLKLMTCNRCYDLRARREQLHEAIYKSCMSIHQASQNRKDEVIEASIETMRTLTRKYSQWFQEIANGPTIIWDDAFPRLLVDRPDKWFTILKNYRDGTQRHWQNSKEIL